MLTIGWGKEKELPQPSRTTYMENSEHRFIASNISNQEEVGVCVEFYLRLLSLLKVLFCTGNLSLKGHDKVGGFRANVGSSAI